MGRLWDDLEDGMAGGLSRECGKRCDWGGVEIGPGDGDPFDVGFEDRCGRFRRKLLYAHRRGQEIMPTFAPQVIRIFSARIAGFGIYGGTTGFTVATRTVD
jgi:hypothetical protein